MLHLGRLNFFFLSGWPPAVLQRTLTLQGALVALPPYQKLLDSAQSNILILPLKSLPRGSQLGAHQLLPVLQLHLFGAHKV